MRWMSKGLCPWLRWKSVVSCVASPRASSEKGAAAASYRTRTRTRTQQVGSSYNTEASARIRRVAVASSPNQLRVLVVPVSRLLVRRANRPKGLVAKRPGQSSHSTWLARTPPINTRQRCKAYFLRTNNAEIWYDRDFCLS